LQSRSRPIDVLQRANLEANVPGLIRGVGNILASLIEQFHRGVERGAWIASAGRRRLEVEVFTIVASRVLDFADRAVDLIDGTMPFGSVLGASVRLQPGSRHAQIRERMKVPGRLGTSRR
jgi:hypothetical protein